ncbi:MAG TPA: HupE/UreJ family protein [bacterium]|nr:HupE/UreJ family protein [bacterium]
MKKIPLWLLALWILPLAAAAHTLKLSDSELSLKENEATWNLKVHLGDFDVKFGRATEPDVKAYIPERLAVSVQGSPCQFEAIDLRKIPAQELVTLNLRYRCPSIATPIKAHYDLFYGDPSHRHLMKIKAGSYSTSFTFDPGNTDFELSGESLGTTILNFLKLGLEHILIGYDHILFVLTLIFGARRFKDLVWLVTSFTLAHSITLALATLAIVSLPPNIVEPAIAASIVFLSLIDFLPGERHGRIMILITFVFGLVHGLGFSYILQEANLKAGNLAIPLIFFNLGVELGQLLIVALVYPLTLALKGLLGGAYRYFRTAVLLGTAGMGLYWFLMRVMS